MRLGIPFLVAAVISFVLIPLCSKFAISVGAIDVPKDQRRMHAKPIPFGGGLAMYISFFITILFFRTFDWVELLGLFLASTIVFVLGFLDDIRPIDAKIKFVVQFFAAGILVASGFSITHFTNFFTGEGQIFLGWFAIPVSLIWIVGVTNTINFVDGLDGLAAGVAAIASVTMLSISIITNSQEVAIVSAILAGSCLGFLPMNFNPAKIFMGDAGAYFIGMILSVISIEGAMKGVAALGIFAPILAVGLPIFDTIFAIIRRAFSGRSMMEADREHTHHRFMDIGFGQKRTVLALYLINAIFGMGAVALIQGDYAYALAFFVIAMILIITPMNLAGTIQPYNNSLNSVNLTDLKGINNKNEQNEEEIGDDEKT